MRAIIAVVFSIGTLLVGLIALDSQQDAAGRQIDSLDTTTAANATAENTLDTINAVFPPVIETISAPVVWVAIAAFILIALGVLVAASGRGGSL